MSVVNFSEDVVFAVDLLYAFTGLCGIVFFCIWKYRTAHNALILSGESLRFTPGWCVGCYFVPIWMFHRPYQCMKDIYDKTFIVGGEKSPHLLLLIWWLSWLFSGVAEVVVAESERNEIICCSYVFSVVSTVLALVVVYRLTATQYKIAGDSELHSKKPMSMEQIHR
jgi:hypothetical protein